eukprot:gnl/MRDRNA2_/MRDRNA2_88764_c0_seq1.p1 gnl/MRDRNA2_/MRDRNA2_88764_c0~~gnl/MRDRNA2_/MRDRNA2_88764_c0_seq1.p1  ORF type:complete len:595 (+),score=106.63 gnl/MRDRNA2_/MRDRNA2_88764_c0_seq1:108-1892(+)
MSRGQVRGSSKGAQPEKKHIPRSKLCVPRAYAGKKSQAMWVRHDFIYEIDFFKDCDPLFLDRIAEGLDTRLYLPNEVIIQEGTDGASMSILHRGSVQVSLEGNKIVELRDGAYFGEIAVLGISSHRTASVTAITICDVRTLPRVHFIRALKEFPAEADRFSELAKVRAAVTVGARLQQAQQEEKRRLQERRQIAMDRARMLGGLKLSLYAAPMEDESDDSDADSVDIRIKRLSTEGGASSRRRTMSVKSSTTKSISAKKATLKLGGKSQRMESPESPTSDKGRRSPIYDTRKSMTSFASDSDDSPRNARFDKKSQPMSKWRLRETMRRSTALMRKSLTVAMRTKPDQAKNMSSEEALDWFATSTVVTKAPRHLRFLKAVHSLQKELWRVGGGGQRPPWDKVQSKQDGTKESQFDSVGCLEMEPSVASMALADWDLEVIRLRQEELEKKQDDLVSVFGENHASVILREVSEHEDKRRESLRRNGASPKGKASKTLHSFGLIRGDNSPKSTIAKDVEVDLEGNGLQEQVASKVLFHGSQAVSGGPLQQFLSDEMTMGMSKSNSFRSPIQKKSSPAWTHSSAGSPYAVSAGSPRGPR